MLRSALFRLSPRNRAIISQATNSRLCETGNNAESQAATGWPNASSDVAYRHVDCLGHCRSALTPCHSQHTPRQPFSTSQHAAQQGKDGERDAHKQAGSAEKPGAASEQGPPGDTQQGSQPVSGSDQGQADTRGSAPEQAPASGDGDTERRLREREAWKNSDGYARLSEEMKRLAGQNKLETNVRTDFGSFFGALTRPLRSLRGRLSVYVMSMIDPEFDEAEFLEGACDAYYIVNRLWSEQDWDALRPMMSQKLLDALRGTTEDYTLHNLTVRVEAGDDIQAAVDNFGFIDQASVDWYGLPGNDEEDAGVTSTPSSRSADPGSPTPPALAGAAAGVRPTATAALPLPGITGAPGGSAPDHRTHRSLWAHAILTVRFRSEDKSTFVNSGGAIVQELKDMKQHLWRFCWGPLCPKAPLPLMPWAYEPVPHLPRPSWRLLDVK